MFENFKTLTRQERKVLIALMTCFRDSVGCVEVHDHNLCDSFLDVRDVDALHILLTSLQEKHFIKVYTDTDGMHCTHICCTDYLTETELRVLEAVIEFRVFGRAMDLRHIACNVREGISKTDLLTALVILDRRGLITLDEHFTVREVFSGALCDEEEQREADIQWPQAESHSGGKF